MLGLRGGFGAEAMSKRLDETIAQAILRGKESFGDRGTEKQRLLLEKRRM